MVEFDIVSLLKLKVKMKFVSYRIVYFILATERCRIHYLAYSQCLADSNTQSKFGADHSIGHSVTHPSTNLATHPTTIPAEYATIPEGQGMSDLQFVIQLWLVEKHFGEQFFENFYINRYENFYDSKNYQ